MAKFSKHQSSTRTKLLMVADSKAGKTTTLASLANAGYKVRILDYDNGLDVLHSWVDPDKIDNISSITLKDDPKSKKGPKAWRTGWNIVTGVWDDGEENLGPVSEFDEDTVLVVDTLAFAGRAACMNALGMNGKKFYDQLTMPEWGQAVRDMEAFLDHITGPEIKCNLVVMTHPIAVDDENEISRLYPKAVTKNFSMNSVAPYFNNVIGLKSLRKGGRVFKLTGDGRQEFAVSRRDIGAEMEADLNKLFKLLQGK